MVHSEADSNPPNLNPKLPVAGPKPRNGRPRLSKNSLSCVAAMARRRRAKSKPAAFKVRFAETGHRHVKVVSSVPKRTSKRVADVAVPSPSNDQIDIALSPKAIADVPTPPSVKLPRRLIRPPYREIDLANVVSIEPELADAPLPYIREILQAVGPRLLAVLASTKSAPAGASLPKEIQVYITEDTLDPPTHMLAVHSRPSHAANTHKVILLPIHSIILATHCANLPALPTLSRRQTPLERSNQPPITLPVVPVNIPSSETFPPLCTYLYTQRADQLLATLLPTPPAPSGPDPFSVQRSLQDLAGRLASENSAVKLLECAMKVNGLWRNVCALGIHDDKLWSTMNVAWDAILSAMAIQSGPPGAVNMDPGVVGEHSETSQTKESSTADAVTSTTDN